MLNLFLAFLAGILIGVIIGLFWFGRAIIKKGLKMIEADYKGVEDPLRHFLLRLFSDTMQKVVIATQDLETFEKKALAEAEGSQKAPKED
jgi:hypothetical protein